MAAAATSVSPPPSPAPGSFPPPSSTTAPPACTSPTQSLHSPSETQVARGFHRCHGTLDALWRRVRSLQAPVHTSQRYTRTHEMRTYVPSMQIVSATGSGGGRGTAALLGAAAAAAAAAAAEAAAAPPPVAAGTLPACVATPDLCPLDGSSKGLRGAERRQFVLCRGTGCRP